MQSGPFPLKLDNTKKIGGNALWRNTDFHCTRFTAMEL